MRHPVPRRRIVRTTGTPHSKPKINTQAARTYRVVLFCRFMHHPALLKTMHPMHGDEVIIAYFAESLKAGNCFIGTFRTSPSSRFLDGSPPFLYD
jgi:hypothetical protein